VRYDDYYAEDPAYLAQVHFTAFADVTAAWQAFQADDLDFAPIPSGELEQAVAEYGLSDDGITVMLGGPVLTGAEYLIHYLCLDTTDSALADPLVRQALSLAIHRKTICDSIYHGAAVPATNIVPPGIAGYGEDAWQYSRYDRAAAKQALDDAGYPEGDGLPTITILSTDVSGYDQVVPAIEADWEALGLDIEVEWVESSDFYPRLEAGDFDVAVLRRYPDYPTIESLLAPLFTSDAYSNYGKYSDPAVDEGLEEARAMLDDSARMTRYWELTKTIGDTSPVIPLFYDAHSHIGSSRVEGLVFSNLGLLNLEYVRVMD
jgi:peptide/nickel transport system substrate-binding protein/oligopeptide transport system substrate-binding protein